jgi:hypothetical protein
LPGDCGVRKAPAGCSSSSSKVVAVIDAVI